MSQKSICTNFLSCLLLILLGNASGEYLAEWVGEGNDIVVVPHNIIRKDKAILYGIIKLRPSGKSSVLELHFDALQFKKQNTVELPTKNLNKFKLFSLGRNNALFIYSDEEDNGTISKFRGIVVDLMRNKQYNIEIPSDFPSRNFLNFIIYADKFDFLTNHSSVCKKFKVCRVSFDQEGRKLGEPVAFSPEKEWEMFFITPAQTNSLSGGFFARHFDEKSKKWQISFMDENAREKSSFEEPEGARYPASNSHNLFSICGIEEKSGESMNKIICTQYDSRTRKMTNSSTPVDKKVVDVAVANLHSGGYVFSTTNCDNSMKCDSFDVTVIAFNGNFAKKGPFSLNLDCNGVTEDKPNSAIAEIGDEMCFSFSCGNKKNYSKFKLYNKCLLEKTFRV
ncbi:hypothetical protein QAD02_009979 [Eretmocerus hayati]|uniref:Uncharacterized protein n=1 Tax=Eretmocerus hayati TaxID=131215 RepID=A0ACC2NB75_9HYME|nr:hypothetical protein QAD02_009979 [Eretmocerus hayati]